MSINNHKHSVICKTHGPLLETENHCFHIGKVFSHYSSNGEVNPISAWFNIASGIESVNYISAKYDEDVMWCNPAIEYEQEKSILHSKLICELTRFNFIWGGLEAFVNNLTLPECPKKRGKGKYSDVNYFLKAVYLENYAVLSYHNELLKFIQVLIDKSPSYSKASQLFCEDTCTSKELVGLKVVYSIRNNFAHGAFQFPEPENYSLQKPLDIPIIVSSSKIVLLYIQMLCIAYYKNYPKSFIWGFSGIDEESMVDIECFLKQLHLKEPSYLLGSHSP